MEDNKQTRRLLIGLGVVCVGIVIIGLGVSVLHSRARGMNESAAVYALNTIATEERTYYKVHGSYATFDQLIEDGALDKGFAGASPVVTGYAFAITVKARDGDAPPAFAVNADPQKGDGFGATGKAHYYMDSASALIRYSKDHPATATDPVLGEH